MPVFINSQNQLNAELPNSVYNQDIIIDDLAALPADRITTLEWPNLVAINGGSLTLRLFSIETLEDAFPNLSFAQEIEVDSCENLTSIPISAFPSYAAGSVTITANPLLEAISGFHSLVTVTNLDLSNNPLLTDISGFCALRICNNAIDIVNNAALTNVDPLCHLTFLSAVITIRDNDALTRYCGLAPLADATMDPQWTALTGNGTNPTRAQIALLEPCAPEWVLPLPAEVVNLLCGDTRTVIEPIETGIPQALYAKEVTFVDDEELIGCETVITRTWTARGFCDVNAEPFVQVITNSRSCPLQIVCPPDVSITCADTDLCPDTTGTPTVIGAVDDSFYEVSYLDFVFKRDLKTCKPLIIKRRWAVTSNCPEEDSVVYCVQTICVPRGWPHFTTCGFTPGQFCGLG